MGSVKRKLTGLEATTKFSEHLIGVPKLKQDTTPWTANFSMEATRGRRPGILESEVKEKNSQPVKVVLSKSNAKFITYNKSDLKHIQ